MAIKIRRPKAGLMFHSDRGSQYTSGRFSRLLMKYKITASMSSVGACLDNAVVERFFGSLKNEWLLNIVHLTRVGMKMDVEEYIRYYNYERLHTTLGNLTPINYENLQREACLSELQVQRVTLTKALLKSTYEVAQIICQNLNIQHKERAVALLCGYEYLTNIQMIEHLVELNQCEFYCSISDLQNRLLMRLNSLNQDAFFC
jgi:hypothetical protein